MADSIVRDISDTAAWMAVYRARETERPDAVFRDPFARALAGERGEKISRALSSGEDAGWAFTARTWLFDRLVTEEIARGVEMVVNLAAGLDARPYRMDLPASLRWIEIDLPRVIDYKEATLAAAEPKCRVERIGLDLSDVAARRRVFAQLGRRAAHTLILSEGLIVYLSPEEVGSLATDLASVPAFERWTADFPSPTLLAALQKGMGRIVRDAGAPFKFAPEEGPDFFLRYGWHPIVVESMFKAGARLHRLPLRLRMLSMLPDSKGTGPRPWSGVCLFERMNASPVPERRARAI